VTFTGEKSAWVEWGKSRSRALVLLPTIRANVARRLQAYLSAHRWVDAWTVMLPSSRSSRMARACLGGVYEIALPRGAV
jgi:hypothetical protein